ncbi:MAG: lytic transglycosylase domain-containing protein [Acidobacteriota bacterium]
MRKGIYIAAVLLLFGVTCFAQTSTSSARSAINRTVLARMDVLSRAALFERAIAAAARKEGVDPKILWAIAYNESRFRPWLTSPKRAQGLMQFIPATAERFGLADPYEPNASIDAAARYVKYLGKQFDWRLDSVLAAYNSGEGTVTAYLQGKSIRSNGRLINASGSRTAGGVPPYKETINYVSQGLKVYRWLEDQGKFQGVSNEIGIYSRDQRTRQEPYTPEESEVEKAPATMVLYDPRTGRRLRLNTSGQDAMRSVGQDGPVILSPDLRSLPAWAARSTFAGGKRP